MTYYKVYKYDDAKNLKKLNYTRFISNIVVALIKRNTLYDY